MKGKLIIARVFDEGKNDVIPCDTLHLNANLFSQQVPFYGEIIMVTFPDSKTLKMINPNITIGVVTLYINGAVMTGPNFSVYQEWVFEPALQAE